MKSNFNIHMYPNGVQLTHILINERIDVPYKARLTWASSRDTMYCTIYIGLVPTPRSTYLGRIKTITGHQFKFICIIRMLAYSHLMSNLFIKLKDTLHRCHMAAKFGLFIDEDHSKLPTLYWLPKLHKRSYKLRFIANSSACTTTELSILFTSCLTAIKNHVIKYCTTVYERNGKIFLGSIKNSGEILNKLKQASYVILVT